MKKTVVNQWDPGKGNYYPHQLDKEGLKSYDIRYTLHGVKFKGTLREQPHGARYAYRAEITAKPVQWHLRCRPWPDPVRRVRNRPGGYELR